MKTYNPPPHHKRSASLTSFYRDDKKKKMTYTIFTDPHLGTSRSAHTSRSSSELLRARLFTEAISLASKPNSICVGDLFDSSTNNEETLLQGFKVASLCKYVLAGNHDEENIVNRVTTLRAIKSLGVNSVVSSNDLSRPSYFIDGQFVFVPHQLSQSMFMESLELAYKSANSGSVLFLHCNYNFEMATSSTATLNLSESVAEQLLDKFNFIFLGHEHKQNSHLNGRVIVVGNTFPTSFSDVSSKRYLELNKNLDNVVSVPTFEVETGLLQIDVNSNVSDDAIKAASFVDVTGVQNNPSDFVKLQNHLWSINKNIYAIRNSTVSKQFEAAEKSQVKTLSIEERLSNELPPELKPFLEKAFAELTKCF